MLGIKETVVLGMKETVVLGIKETRAETESLLTWQEDIGNFSILNQ